MEGLGFIYKLHWAGFLANRGHDSVMLLIPVTHPSDFSKSFSQGLSAPDMLSNFP